MDSVPSPRACANPTCVRSILPATSAFRRRTASAPFCSAACENAVIASSLRRELSSAVSANQMGGLISWRGKEQQSVDVASPQERLEDVVRSMLAAPVYNDDEPDLLALLASLTPQLRPLAHSGHQQHGRGYLRLPMGSLLRSTAQGAEYFAVTAGSGIGRAWRAVECYEAGTEGVVLVVGEGRTVWAII